MLLVIPGELNPAATPVNLPFGTQTVWGSSGILPPLAGWATLQGSPSVSGSTLVLPNGGSTTQIVYCKSNIPVASWSLTATMASVASGVIELRFMMDTATSTLSNAIVWLLNNSTGGYSMSKYVSGSGTNLITSTVTPDTSKHTYTVTRDSSGNFDLLLDGVSKGTATDTFLPTISYMEIVSTIPGNLTIYNIEVS